MPNCYNMESLIPGDEQHFFLFLTEFILMYYYRVFYNTYIKKALHTVRYWFLKWKWKPFTKIKFQSE